MNFERTMVDLFTFVVLVSTTASLFAYLFSALAALRLQRREALERSALLSVLALVAVIYSLWAIWGAGLEPALLGIAFLLSALPIHWFMRRAHVRLKTTK
jgi:APA family basic amino acid/polyamine antiporter